jgi:paraquat-inducible protein A
MARATPARDANAGPRPPARVYTGSLHARRKIPADMAWYAPLHYARAHGLYCRLKRFVSGTGMSSVIVCHACDLVQRRNTGASRARCARCNAELYRTTTASIDTAVALCFTAAVLLLLSNLYPLVALQMNGASRETTLIGAALGLYREGYGLIGALVLLTTVLIPAFQIGSLLYVLLPLRKSRRAKRQNELFRTLTRLRPWALPEVFMLGAIVALVKLSALAQVVPGISLFAYATFMLAMAALTSITPSEQFWHWVEGTRA